MAPWCTWADPHEKAPPKNTMVEKIKTLRVYHRYGKKEGITLE
jgi:hypothetical protein